MRAQGLKLQEADLVVVLQRSLPEKCRTVCFIKFEVQQRVWSEGSGSKLNPVQTDPKGKSGDEKGNSKGRVRRVQKVGARVYPECGQEQQE